MSDGFSSLRGPPNTPIISWLPNQRRRDAEEAAGAEDRRRRRKRSMWLKKKTPWRRRRKDGGERNVKEMRPIQAHTLPSSLQASERLRETDVPPQSWERAAQAARKNKVSRLSAQTKHKQSPMKSVLFLLNSVSFPKFLLLHLILLEFAYTLNANFTITECVQHMLWTASGLFTDLHVSSQHNIDRFLQNSTEVFQKTARLCVYG